MSKHKSHGSKQQQDFNKVTLSKSDHLKTSNESEQQRTTSSTKKQKVNETATEPKENKAKRKGLGSAGKDEPEDEERYSKRSKKLVVSMDEDEELEVNKDESINTPKNHRRLDALARLLEGSGTCAAVCFDGKKILIASNKLHSTSQKNNLTKELIQKVMSFFACIARGENTSKKEKIDLFSSIVQQYVPAQQKEFILKNDKNPNQFLGNLAEYFLALKGRSAKKAENLSPKELARIAEWGNILDAKSASNLIYAAFAIERLAIDFKKLIAALQHGVGEFQAEIIEAFKKSGSILTVNKSLKEYKLDGNRKSGYELLQIGPSKKTLHAEMQIIQRIIDKEKTGEIYIGISKLCCLKCNIVIKACNAVYNKSNQITLSQGSDEVSNEEILNLLNRGAHNIDFEWSKPAFCTENKEIDRDFEELYKKVEEYPDLISRIAEISEKLNEIKESKVDKTKKGKAKYTSLLKEKSELEDKLNSSIDSLKGLIVSNSYVAMHPIPSSSSEPSSPSSVSSEVSVSKAHLKKQNDLEVFDKALKLLKSEDAALVKSISTLRKSWSNANSVKLNLQNISQLTDLITSIPSNSASNKMKEAIDSLKELVPNNEIIFAKFKAKAAGYSSSSSDDKRNITEKPGSKVGTGIKNPILQKSKRSRDT